VAQLARRFAGNDDAGSLPVSYAQVRRVLERLRTSTSRQRRKWGVDEQRSDIIYAGTAICEGVMRRLRVEELEITQRGLRDGLMADLIRRTVRARGAHLHQESAVLDGLRAFGRRCAYREEHAEQVAHLSLSLFDQLPDLHRLGEEERALCTPRPCCTTWARSSRTTAITSTATISCYHADLPGYTDRERELIATIARYHRRSSPKEGHEEFQRLTPQERVVVRNLAAILRVADGLDRGHRRHIRSLTARQWGNGVHIDVKRSGAATWRSGRPPESRSPEEIAGGPVRIRMVER